jgi:hypothetical protein
VVELSEASQNECFNENLNASYLYPGENPVQRKISQKLARRRLSNELPQRRISNDLTQQFLAKDLHQRRMSSPLAVHSYEIDENGDPCSAV